MQTVAADIGHDENFEEPPIDTGIGPAQDLSDFWSVSQESLLHRLRFTPREISAEEARRLLTGGPTHSIRDGCWAGTLSLLAAQFQSPIILILLMAASLSLILGEVTDASIIFVIVLASGLLGFWQEWGRPMP